MKKLAPFDYKILLTAYFLNENKDYPLSSGIYKILKGIKDDDTFKYASLPTFSTHISATNKKVTCRCNSLIKDELISKVYLKENDEYYFCITSKGKQIVEEYLKNSKIHLKRKDFKHVKSIVHIDSF